MNIQASAKALPTTDQKSAKPTPNTGTRNAVARSHQSLRHRQLEKEYGAAL